MPDKQRLEQPHLLDASISEHPAEFRHRLEFQQLLRNEINHADEQMVMYLAIDPMEHGMGVDEICDFVSREAFSTASDPRMPAQYPLSTSQCYRLQ